MFVKALLLFISCHNSVFLEYQKVENEATNVENGKLNDYYVLNFFRLYILAVTSFDLLV